jgi:hypothetical protein
MKTEPQCFKLVRTNQLDCGETLPQVGWVGCRLIDIKKGDRFRLVDGTRVYEGTALEDASINEDGITAILS